MAVDAVDVLRSARTHATLDAALSRGAATVVGTSRRMGKHRQPHHRLDALGAALARPDRSRRGRAGLRPGRSRFERRRSRSLHAPDLRADRCGVSGAERRADDRDRRLRGARALDAAEPESIEPDDEVLADHAGREAMYAHLEEALLAIGFLKVGQLDGDDAPPATHPVARPAHRRATSTSCAVSRRQILWLARQARLDLRKRT